jgi:hypothetical protein
MNRQGFVPAVHKVSVTFPSPAEQLQICGPAPRAFHAHGRSRLLTKGNAQRSFHAILNIECPDQCKPELSAALCRQAIVLQIAAAAGTRQMRQAEFSSGPEVNRYTERQPPQLVGIWLYCIAKAESPCTCGNCIQRNIGATYAPATYCCGAYFSASLASSSARRAARCSFSSRALIAISRTASNSSRRT